ncbi:MAG: hypothetical protein AB7D05_10990, partial [Mangrovibacterium sp.]
VLSCMLQFFLGHKLGVRYGEPVAGTQGLGQKNTVLMIWMSLTYLDPLSSIAPVAYVVCHNVVNALQLHRHARKVFTPSV